MCDYFTISVETHGGVVVLKLQGECDSIVAPLLGKRIEEYRRKPIIVVDFSDLTLLSAAAVTVLIQHKNLLGDRLCFSVPPTTNGIVRRVLEVTGVVPAI